MHNINTLSFWSSCLLLFLSSFQLNAQCTDVVIELDSQADVDNFATNFGCTTIEGDLFIIGEDITNLNGLSGLTNITDDVQIDETNLTSLNGLDNLTNIGGDFSLTDNNDLENISSLGLLQTIGGNFEVTGFVQQDFIFPSLTHIEGDIATGEVNGNLSMPNLQTLGGNLSDARAFTSISNSLSNLTSIGGDLGIYWVDANSLNFLSSLTAIGGTLYLEEVWGLSNLSGLENLTSVGGIWFFSSYDLQNIDALSNLTTIENGLYLEYVSIENLEPLNNLSTVGGSINIRHVNCTDLPEFPNLTSLEGGLTILGFDYMTSLNGFNHLNSIGGNLWIQYNYELVELTGFDNLNYVDEGIFIQDNEQLIDCCILTEWQEFTDYIVLENNNTICNDLEGLGNFCDGSIGECGGLIVLSTQSEVDAFPTNYPCTEILGHLVIEGNSIDNLEGLETLTSIIGDLTIQNTSLNTLEGLENLISVDGNLTINDNGLDDLDGLANLESVGSDLFLYYDNPNYTFESLTYIGGSISNLENIGTNGNLFPALTTIGGDVDLVWISLPNINALSNITTIGGTLYIEEAWGLENLDPLSNLTTIGGSLVFYWATGTSNIDGLSNLTSVGGDVSFSYSVSDLSPLSNLQHIGGGITLEQLGMSSFDFFNNVETLGGSITIWACDELVNIEGFDNLTTIDGSIIINNNEELLTIGGFENLTSIGDGVEILQNFKLSDCCILLDWESIATNSVIVEENNDGCNSFEEINSFCDDDGDPCTGTIILYSQTDIDNFPTDYGCTIIEGDLFIQGDDITNLDGLSTVISIMDDFQLINTPNLNDMEGLSNLTNVVGILEIGYSNDLDIVKLDNLETVGGNFEVHSTGNHSFQSLTSIGGDISQADFLAGNPNIFPNLTQVGGSIFLYWGAGLENVDHFSGLETIGGDLFFDDVFIDDLDGFSNLTSIGGNLNFWSAHTLENLDGLANLTTIGGSLHMSLMSGLENIDGLGSLTSIGGVLILSSLTGNLDGLSALESVGSNLHISGVETDIILGFESLTTIGGTLEINGCDNLTDLYAFSNLISVGEDLFISFNEELTGFGGFNNLETVAEFISVSENYKLSECCVLKCLQGVAGFEMLVENNNDGCNSFEEVLQNCEGEYEDCEVDDLAEITAFSFYDTNENGIFDGDDYGLQNQAFTLQPDEVYTYSNESGITTFLVTEGEYTLVLAENAFWELTTETYQYPVTLDDAGTQYNFGLKPVTGFSLVQGDLTSAPTRCGFEVKHWLSYKNEGTNTADGVLRLTPDALTDFVNADPLPSYVDGDVLYWTFEDLLPTYEEQIEITFQMPGVDFIGTNLTSIGEVWSLDETGDTLSENKFFYTSELTCAYDPNDKLVTPEGEGDDNYTLFIDSLLEYTVRFQNTGNDTAFNVFITDTLSENLDWETFEVISSSHELKTFYEPENGFIEFRFDNIELPDSNVNEPLSHGFVKYQIEIEEGLPENTSVENTAHIYFDFNPAIVTNTTQNTMVTEIPVSIIAIDDKQSLHLYPNPARDYVYLNFEGEINEPISIKLLDVVGNEILAKENIFHQEQLNVSSLSNGIYLLQVQIGKRIVNEKIVIQ